jgi:hypothetical protein
MGESYFELVGNLVTFVYVITNYFTSYANLNCLDE